MRKECRIAAGIVMLGLLAACGGGSDSSQPPGPADPPIADAPAPAPVACDSPAVATATDSPPRPAASASIVHEQRASGDRVWVVNRDNDSVSVIDAASMSRIAEIPVGRSPRSLAIAKNGCVWVVNRESASVSVIDGVSLGTVKTIALSRASQPHGIVFAAADGSPWVSLEAIGQVARLDPASGAVTASIAVGSNPRHLSLSADGRQLLVSRFVSPPLPGESTANPQPQQGGVDHGGEIVVADTAQLAIRKTIVLRVSDRQDSSLQARGLPNYLGAAAIAPDGLSAWVPSKQDNVMRGALRDGLPLDFQSTVRAISSRIVLGASLTEDHDLRVDHDNAGVATAAVFEPTGAYLFVALETSREIAVIDPAGGREVTRFRTGRAPQGLAVSRDGSRLYVDNFMDRTVGVFDLSQLLSGQPVRNLATIATVAGDKLAPEVLKGKRFFYDALDPRLARDSYLSCASCHADGGGDGRVWDLTGFGEGLRRTISLLGRAGSQPLHWSGNFDETQDFEGQIRSFAGGQGLMTDEDFAATSDPMGAPKAGLSSDLDALSAYLASLASFEPSPYRNPDGSLTAAAQLGKARFDSAGCAGCHAGPGFGGADGILHDVGTLKPSSGKRLGGPLTGIDTPTLRNAWTAGPYLHDGSARTVTDAIAAHSSAGSLSGEDLGRLSAYVMQIGAEE